jgi:hypothetical protein
MFLCAGTLAISLTLRHRHPHEQLAPGLLRKSMPGMCELLARITHLHPHGPVSQLLLGMSFLVKNFVELPVWIFLKLCVRIKLKPNINRNVKLNVTHLIR